MELKIKKGSHRAFPFPIGIYYNRTEFKYEIKFNRSVVYDIGDNQLDINKLCGVGYLPSHETYSARFGWRYVANVDKIEILAYVHDKNFVTTQSNEVSIGYIDFDQYYTIILDISKEYYTFTLVGQGYKSVSKTHNKKLGYKLGFYFGGDLVAPQNMSVIINNK